MHTMHSNEETGMVHLKSKKWEKPRNQSFQSSISTLPGPSITIRNEQIPYSKKTADQLDVTRSPKSDITRSIVDPIDRSDTVSVTTTESSFKNQIPNLYGGKFSPENIPKVDFRKKK